MGVILQLDVIGFGYIGDFCYYCAIKILLYCLMIL